MTQGKKFWVVIGALALAVSVTVVASGVLSPVEVGLLLVVIGLCAFIEEGKVRLVWQGARIFQYAGLYLLVGSKRYRIWKAGTR